MSDSSASPIKGHPKIASTGVSDSAPKEFRDRAYTAMEYEINHGWTDELEMTENGYRPRAYNFFDPEFAEVTKKIEARLKTPEGQKGTLLFAFPAVKAVVHDSAGNIIATDRVDPQHLIDVDNNGSSMDKALDELEKQRPDLTVIRYSDSQKVTDLDLLRYEVAHAKEQIKVNPEFRDTYNKMARAMHPEMPENVTDVLAFQESILAAK